MLCAEFPQVQYINLSEIVNVLKVVAIVTHVQSNLLNTDTERDRAKCLLYRGVHIIDVGNV